jgi:hypothetical protein
MPALGTKGFSEIQFRDATGEATTTSIRTVTLAAGNFAAEATLAATFYAATAAIVLGTVAQTVAGNREVISNGTPTNPAAQRESKLLVNYWDVTTQKRYQITIGTINFDMLVFLPGAGDAVAFTTANGAPSEITNWVTAFEGVAKAPDTGNAVAVTSMKYVGRNT